MMMYLIFTGMLMAAVLLIFKPLRLQFLMTKCIITLVLAGVTIAGYMTLGGQEYHRFLQHQVLEKKSKALLQSFKNSDEVIEKLKQILHDKPNSAKGWYLLGRLYVSHSDWHEAVSSFSKAHDLEPTNERYTIQYIESMWQLHAQQFTPHILQMLTDVLRQNPKQLDALSMLALSAFQEKNYTLAITYWERMLVLLPKDSNEAQSIRKAIGRVKSGDE